MIFLIKNYFVFYFIFFFNLLFYAFNYNEKKNNFIEINKYQNHSFYLRKTHPIELTIESGSIRGEYLVKKFFFLILCFKNYK